MNRLLLAIVSTVAATAPVSVSAQAINHYVATPAAQPGKARLVTRGTPWFVRGASIVAPRAPETPSKVCAMVASKVGPLTAFSVAGTAFDTTDLAACNAAAPAPALASAN